MPPSIDIEKWERLAAKQLKEGEVRDIILNSTMSSPESWNPAIGRGMPSADYLDVKYNTSFSSASYPVVSGCSFEPRPHETFDTILLYPGWNMISIPLPLSSGNATAQILGQIDTAAHTIWRYHAGEGSWSAVNPEDELFQMDVVWVYSRDTGNVSLQCDTSAVNQTVKQLHPGWNPVGVPGKESITAQNLLAPLTDAWTTVLVFDSKTQEFRPSIINGGIGTYSPSRLVYPSEGWWIYMNRPGILFPVC